MYAFHEGRQRGRDVRRVRKEIHAASWKIPATERASKREETRSRYRSLATTVTLISVTETRRAWKRKKKNERRDTRLDSAWLGSARLDLAEIVGRAIINREKKEKRREWRTEISTDYYVLPPLSQDKLIPRFSAEESLLSRLCRPGDRRLLSPVPSLRSSRH